MAKQAPRQVELPDQGLMDRAGAPDMAIRYRWVADGKGGRALREVPSGLLLLRRPKGGQ